MATISYDEKFIITKQETLDRLERVALKFQPAEMRNKNAINEMKQREERLVKIIFRSKP